MEENFKWRKVTEQEKEEILFEAKQLLNNFATKIEKISVPEIHFENESGFREEGSGWKTDPEFKEIMFANAPFVEDDSIIAEKGAWK